MRWSFVLGVFFFSLVLTTFAISAPCEGGAACSGGVCVGGSQLNCFDSEHMSFAMKNQ
jgi:hypothetical protein